MYLSGNRAWQQPREAGTASKVHANLCFPFPDGNRATLQLKQLSRTGCMQLCAQKAQLLIPNAFTTRLDSPVHSLPLLHYALQSLITQLPVMLQEAADLC